MTTWEDVAESALWETRKRTPRCAHCGALLEDVEWVDVSTLGDLEPQYVMGRSRCPTAGCGTTCPICRRPPGDIHSGACTPFVLSKLQDPCRVSREDCLATLSEGNHPV